MLYFRALKLTVIACLIHASTLVHANDENFRYIFNLMPKCYVLLEVIELHEDKKSPSMADFYYMYEMASQGLMNRDKWHRIPIYFNVQAQKEREIVFHQIIEEGYQPSLYQKLYKETNCKAIAENAMK